MVGFTEVMVLMVAMAVWAAPFRAMLSPVEKMGSTKRAASPIMT